MDNHRIVSKEEWLISRKELLAKEKELTRMRDELSRARRELPWERVEKEYVFDSTSGKKTLSDLFDGRSQLIVYHFMFDPSWQEGCKSCSNLADSIDGAVLHLGARDTAFTMVSRAPLDKIDAFKKRMGWRFPWCSSNGSDFNYDFHVTLDPEKKDYEYNYAKAQTLLEAGKIWFPKGEMPGLSVFLRDGDTVYHTYSTYQRGLDLPLNTYNFLDLTPLGRQEEGDRIQGWVRHHDRYGASQAATP